MKLINEKVSSKELNRIVAPWTKYYDMAWYGVHSSITTKFFHIADQKYKLTTKDDLVRIFCG